MGQAEKKLVMFALPTFGKRWDAIDSYVFGAHDKGAGDDSLFIHPKLLSYLEREDLEKTVSEAKATPFTCWTMTTSL